MCGRRSPGGDCCDGSTQIVDGDVCGLVDRTHVVRVPDTDGSGFEGLGAQGPAEVGRFVETERGELGELGVHEGLRKRITTDVRDEQAPRERAAVLGVRDSEHVQPPVGSVETGQRRTESHRPADADTADELPCTRVEHPPHLGERSTVQHLHDEPSGLRIPEHLVGPVRAFHRRGPLHLR